jgi:hypothetical protein
MYNIVERSADGKSHLFYRNVRTYDKKIKSTSRVQRSLKISLHKIERGTDHVKRYR